VEEAGNEVQVHVAGTTANVGREIADAVADAGVVIHAGHDGITVSFPTL
jgi:hypothetical protein